MNQHALLSTHRRGGALWQRIAFLLLLAGIGSEASLHAQTTSAEPKALGSGPRQADRSLPAIETIRAAAEKAYGSPLARGTWRMQGTTRFHGAEATYEMVFDDRYRFQTRIQGALSQTEAFDGSTYWSSGLAGMPHRVILADRDQSRMLVWTITGAWTAKNAPLVRTAQSGDPGELAVTLKPKDGAVEATLTLDAKTFETKSLRYWTSSGIETWAFTAYQSFDRHKVPTHIVRTSGQQTEPLELRSLEKSEGNAPLYSMPKPAVAPAEYDSSANERVEVKRIRGYMFVRPKVNGEEVGWFFLDTGAEVSCIDPSVVKKLNMSVVGSDEVAGVVEVSHLRFCRAMELQLGPVKVPKPVFLELDLAPFAQALKLPVVGICGYDFLARAALDMDPQADTIRVMKPGSASLPADARWTRIDFNGNVPCLKCSFAENHEGFFTLDTGSNATVDFFTPAVEKYQLLANRETTTVQTGGAGGSAESRRGKIPWFNLGGNRLENPIVGFQLTKRGAFASPYVTGNVGMGFMGQYRIVLDYANERIAFIGK